MSRPLKIVIGLVSFITILIVCLIIKYNVTFGKTIFQKSTMVGCMNSAIKKYGFDKSKQYCECTLGKLFEKYSDEEIRYDYDNIEKNEIELIRNCVKENLK